MVSKVPVRAAGSRIGCGLILVLCALALGCTANKKPSRMERTLADLAKDVVIPLQAEKLKNPLDPHDAAAVREGQQIYGQACALCHGASGRADSQMGQSMYPPAMDLTSPHASSWTDAELFWIVQNGIRFTGMPAWKSQIGDSDTWKSFFFERCRPRRRPPRPRRLPYRPRQGATPRVTESSCTVRRAALCATNWMAKAEPWGRIFPFKAPGSEATTG